MDPFFVNLGVGATVVAMLLRISGKLGRIDTKIGVLCEDSRDHESRLRTLESRPSAPKARSQRAAGDCPS